MVHFECHSKCRRRSAISRERTVPSIEKFDVALESFISHVNIYGRNAMRVITSLIKIQFATLFTSMPSIEALDKFLPTCDCVCALLPASSPGKINIHNKRTHIRIGEGQERDRVPLKAKRRVGLTTAVYAWNLYCQCVTHFRRWLLCMQGSDRVIQLA